MIDQGRTRERNQVKTHRRLWGTVLGEHLRCTLEVLRRELHRERASKEHSFAEEEEQRPVGACYVFLWLCLCFQRRTLGFRVLGLTFFTQYQWTGRLFSFRGSWKVLSWRNGDYQKLPLNLKYPKSLYWSVTRKSDYLFPFIMKYIHT